MSIPATGMKHFHHPSANRFAIQITVGIEWANATKDKEDARGSKSLDDELLLVPNPNIRFKKRNLVTYKTKLKLDREVGGGDLSELRNCKRLINKLTEVLIRLM